jgi:HEAT repeat protein
MLRRLRALLLISTALCGAAWGGQTVQLQSASDDDPSPKELASQLESPDVAVRRKAALGLYQLRWHAGPAIPALTKALKDPDSEVRGYAAASFRFLGPRIGDPREAIPLLAELVRKDPDLDNRRAAAATLGMLCEQDRSLMRDVASLLSELLGDKDKWIRLKVAVVLASLEKDGKKPFRVLEELLGEDDDEFREDLILGLDRIGRPALPMLMSCMRKDGVSTRRIAASSIACIVTSLRRKHQEVSPELIMLLRTALGDSDDEVVIDAVRALATIGAAAKDSIPKIARFLDHRNANVRYQAVAALGVFGELAKASLPAVEKALSDESPLVRVGATRALGMMLGEKALPTLVKCLSDSDREVRLTALEALLGMKADPKLLVPVFVKALADKEMAVQTKAIDSLVSLGPAGEPAIPELAALLDYPDQWVRVSAAEALGKFGPAAKKTIPKLVESLTDSSWVVRCRAANSLGQVGGDAPKVVPALIQSLHDKSGGVRMWAAWSLGRFGQDARDAIPRLTELLEDSDPNVRDYAAAALKDIKHECQTRPMPSSCRFTV